MNHPIQPLGLSLAALALFTVSTASALETIPISPAEKGGQEVASSFFSRTLGESGPMRKLSGDQEWRPFILPGHINDGSGRKPLRLELNAVIPGAGTVEIRDLKLLPELPVSDRAESRGAGTGVVLAALAAGAAAAGLVAATAIVLERRKTRAELERIRNADAVASVRSDE